MCASRAALLVLASFATCTINQRTQLWSVRQAVESVGPLAADSGVIRLIIENGLDGKSVLRTDLENDLRTQLWSARQVVESFGSLAASSAPVELAPKSAQRSFNALATASTLLTGPSAGGSSSDGGSDLVELAPRPAQSNLNVFAASSKLLKGFAMSASPRPPRALQGFEPTGERAIRLVTLRHCTWAASRLESQHAYSHSRL